MLNAVNKLRINCHQVLQKLDVSISKVLKINNHDSNRNPVSPEIIYMAFYQACEVVDSETEIRLIMFKYFENNSASSFNNVYSEIDKIIEKFNLPKMSESIKQQTLKKGYHH